MNYHAENRTPRDRVKGDLFQTMEDVPGYSYGNTDASFAIPTSAMRGTRQPFCPRKSAGCREPEKCRKPAKDPLAGLPLAMAYVPMQEWENIYELEKGFTHGTIFRDLDFPFYPTPCGKKGGCCQ